MTSMYAVGSAIGICAGAAALEGILAGSGVRRRLSALRRPSFSPTFGVWIVIGVTYYALCGVVLYRVLQMDPSTSGRALALVLIALLLVLNAGWNFFFFRRRDLRTSFLFNLPYGAVALGLLVALFRMNPVAGWIFLPYVIYLGYAVWFCYEIWRLNP